MKPMTTILKILFSICLAICLSHALEGAPTEGKLKTLYNRMDPYSLSQHLSFYELYPQHPLGQQALRHAHCLLTISSTTNPPLPHLSASQSLPSIPLTNEVINGLIALVNKPLGEEVPLLSHETLKEIAYLSAPLPHTKLQGHSAWTEEEILALPQKEIDLARAIFISQFSHDANQILTYEALIDLIALQILAKLPRQANDEAKIAAINAFIFDEMDFRFPPHSQSTKEIDTYSFLPSVLDKHRGVCLGVSILYLCIAQRLALPLEIVTPPGHIYVRYRSGDKVINIETTARGIHLDSERYLGVNIKELQQRPLKQVIGMAHFNQASIYWQLGDHEKALAAYQKAEPYMRDDPVLKELMGYILVLNGKVEEGEALLYAVENYIPPHAITNSSLIEDYFKGDVDIHGIKCIFSKSEEDRESILKQKEVMQNLIVQYPRFRSGHLSLAMTWIELHRPGEALEALKVYDTIDNQNPEVNYYLSVLYAQRHDYLRAWHHLRQAEAIVKQANWNPPQLKELRRELLKHCPE
jgi:tetratricopeptide (TPR) repeat protein